MDVPHEAGDSGFVEVAPPGGAEGRLECGEAGVAGDDVEGDLLVLEQLVVEHFADDQIAAEDSSAVVDVVEVGLHAGEIAVEDACAERVELADSHHCHGDLRVGYSGYSLDRDELVAVDLDRDEIDDFRIGGVRVCCVRAAGSGIVGSGVFGCGLRRSRVIGCASGVVLGGGLHGLVVAAVAAGRGHQREPHEYGEKPDEPSIHVSPKMTIRPDAVTHLTLVLDRR
jgi:hypothetical protein